MKPDTTERELSRVVYPNGWCPECRMTTGIILYVGWSFECNLCRTSFNRLPSMWLGKPMTARKLFSQREGEG